MNVIDIRQQAKQLTDETRPTVPLCWEEQEDTMLRCDRKRYHEGKHSWEFTPIEAEVAVHGDISGDKKD